MAHATPRRASSLVICDPDGAQLFTGESLLGVQLGGLRVGPRRRDAREAAGCAERPVAVGTRDRPAP